MALKTIFEMNNISMNDTSKSDMYLLAPPEGKMTFPTKDSKIPVSMKHFHTIVIDTPTIKVGTTTIDDFNL